MSKHTDLVGLLKYAMDEGKKQALSAQRKGTVKTASVLRTYQRKVQMRTKVASILKRAGPMGDSWGKALASPTVGGFASHAYAGTPGWAKAIALLGAGGLGVGLGAHLGNELQRRFDPGVNPGDIGTGMDRNLRKNIEEQTAKATSRYAELGGMQQAMRNAYSPMYH